MYEERKISKRDMDLARLQLLNSKNACTHLSHDEITAVVQHLLDNVSELKTLFAGVNSTDVFNTMHELIQLSPVVYMKKKSKSDESISRMNSLGSKSMEIISDEMLIDLIEIEKNETGIVDIGESTTDKFNSERMGNDGVESGRESTNEKNTFNIVENNAKEGMIESDIQSSEKDKFSSEKVMDGLKSGNEISYVSKLFSQKSVSNNTSTNEIIDKNMKSVRHEDIIYRRGKLTSSCTFILSGTVLVLTGDEGIPTEYGPFTALATETLLRPDGTFIPNFMAYLLTETVHMVVINIHSPEVGHIEILNRRKSEIGINAAIFQRLTTPHPRIMRQSSSTDVGKFKGSPRYTNAISIGLSSRTKDSDFYNSE